MERRRDEVSSNIDPIFILLKERRRLVVLIQGLGRGRATRVTGVGPGSEVGERDKRAEGGTRRGKEDVSRRSPACLRATLGWCGRRQVVGGHERSGGPPFRLRVDTGDPRMS